MLAQAINAIPSPYPATYVPDMPLGYHVSYSIIIIVHLLLAITLLGALTHQTVAVLWPARPVVPAPGGHVGSPFTRAYRGVRVQLYTNVVIWLYLITALVGAFLYGPYRLTILPYFYGHGLKLFGGVFELKEHFVVIGLALLPVYWYLWKKVALNEQVAWRAAVTTILAVFVWYSFLVGHVLNNLRGLGT
jgi:hypothetical protein